MIISGIYLLLDHLEFLVLKSNVDQLFGLFPGFFKPFLCLELFLLQVIDSIIDLLVLLLFSMPHDFDR